MRQGGEDMSISSDYKALREGMVYSDSLLGEIWRLSRKSDDRMELKALSVCNDINISMDIGQDMVTLRFAPRKSQSETARLR